MNRMNQLSLYISLLLPTMPAFATDNYSIYRPDGTNMFEVRFFDQHDGLFFGDEDGDGYESTWDLDSNKKHKILNAIAYWAEIITPAAGQPPAVINIGTFDDINAAGGSQNASSGEVSQTKLQAALQGQPTGGALFGAHGMFIIGKMDFDNQDYVPSQLPRSPQVDLYSVAFHELAHALGISASVYDVNDNDPSPFFDNTLTVWDSHLRDDNGNASLPGQPVLCTGCSNAYDPAAFDVRREGGYFSGSHVSEVLTGALPGIPVRITEDGYIDDNYMSHPELKNSLMSHQEYRNYTTFMEVELATLQDLGYNIDRRNFYGYSVYGDGQTINNHHPFLLRNTSGTDYLPNRYNTSTLGIGLHIYGNNNQLFQQADLLTIGDGAAGIRVDGTGNTLVINSGTRVYADGVNGMGLMFSYGKNHSLQLDGDVQALGRGGIAASFNFGNNLLGNGSEYRGSYIRWVDGQPDDLLDELAGALVNRVDITGRLAGNAAAIFISGNALVNQINIMRGAQLTGDIISYYNERDSAGQQRLTQLTFGQRPNGIAALADPTFSLQYAGNIQGIDNLELSVLAGYTSLQGEHEVYSMEIAPEATLTGNSRYTLHSQGRFNNAGRLSLANISDDIEIIGHYQQTPSGLLQLAVNDQGDHSTLTVSGSADLEGTLALAVEPGWYGNNWQIETDDMLNLSQAQGEFSQLTSNLASPTLLLKTQALGNQLYRFTFSRSLNAYSQYAQSQNALQVGSVLDRLVNVPGADIRTLYRALDFSAASGQDIQHALS